MSLRLLQSIKSRSMPTLGSLALWAMPDARGSAELTDVATDDGESKQDDDTWRQLVDRHGVKYYDNAHRRISQYEDPKFGIVGSPILAVEDFFGESDSSSGGMRMGRALNIKMQSMNLELPNGWEVVVDKYGMTCYINPHRNKRQYTHPALNAPPFEPALTDYAFGYPFSPSPWAWLRYYWLRELKLSHYLIAFLCSVGMFSPPSDIRAQRRIIFRFFYLVACVLCGSMMRSVSAVWYVDNLRDGSVDFTEISALQYCDKILSCRVTQFFALLIIVSIPLMLYLVVVFRLFKNKAELARLKALGTLHVKYSEDRRFLAPFMVAFLSVLLLALTSTVVALFFIGNQRYGSSGTVVDVIEGIIQSFFVEILLCLKPHDLKVVYRLFRGDKNAALDEATAEIHKEVGKLLSYRAIKMEEE